MNSVNSNILVINDGSFSIKFALYSMDENLKKILFWQESFSTINSKATVYVIPTDEEIMIAQETRKLYRNAQIKTQ